MCQNPQTSASSRQGSTPKAATRCGSLARLSAWWTFPHFNHGEFWDSNAAWKFSDGKLYQDCYCPITYVRSDTCHTQFSQPLEVRSFSQCNWTCWNVNTSADLVDAWLVFQQGKVTTCIQIYSRSCRFECWKHKLDRCWDFEMQAKHRIW